ncbi:MAG: Ig-like domain-containing protein [Bacteroidaceae bacterium]|nr:Ig-like domain-containing protein [Bacteroidaceae bacterium]
MKRNYLWASLLLVTALLSGCSNEEDLVGQSPSQTWTATVFASKDSITGEWDDVDEQETRAVFVGGNTYRMANAWDAGDVVQVYKDGVNVGFLSLDAAANEDYQFTKSAQLSGTLTGTFAKGDEVELYLPSKARSYVGQKGDINDLSAHYSYQYQTVKVKSVSGTTVQLESANMWQRQAFLRLIFTDEAGKRLHPSQLTISASATSANRIVTSVGEDGTTMTYGNIVVNAKEENGEYPGELFVAILNEGYDELARTHGKVDYKFTAIVDGMVYTGPSDRPVNAAPTLGSLSRVIRVLTPSSSTATASFPASMTLLQYTAKTRLPKVISEGEDVTGQCAFSFQSSDYSVAAVNPSTGAVVGIKPGTATITATSKPYGATASYTVTVIGETDGENTANYVDLGLPSGTLWAAANVGATSATGAGTYFAWGEWDGYTSASNWNRENFTAATYVTGNPVTSSTGASATTSADPLDATAQLLDRSFDAATLNMGSAWELPTEAEWQELLATQQSSNYTWNWDTSSKAWKIYSKLTKQTLYLPAVGYRSGNSTTGVGTAGAYWSSTVAAGSSARYLTFSQSNTALSAGARSNAYAVRAVKSKSIFNLTARLAAMGLEEWKEWKPEVTLPTMENGGNIDGDEDSGGSEGDGGGSGEINAAPTRR